MWIGHGHSGPERAARGRPTGSAGPEAGLYWYFSRRPGTRGLARGPRSDRPSDPTFHIPDDQISCAPRQPFLGAAPGWASCAWRRCAARWSPSDGASREPVARASRDGRVGRQLRLEGRRRQSCNRAATQSMPRSRSASPWRSRTRARGTLAAAASWSSAWPMDGRRRSIIARWRRPRPQRRHVPRRAGQSRRARSLVGPLAAGVPGSVAGLALAQRQYGRLPLATVMAPAIELARDGFEISWSFAESLASHRSLFSRFPVHRPRVPARGRHASCCRRATAASRPGHHAPGHRRAGSGRVLPRSDRAADRGRDVAHRRPHHHCRSRALRADRKACPRRRLPRSPHRVDGAPEFRRRGAAAAAEHPRGLSAGRIRPQFVTHDAPHDRSRAPSLCRSVRMARRSCVRPRSGRLASSPSRTPTTSARASTRGGRRRAAPSNPDSPATYESSQTTHYSVVDAEGNAVSTTTTLNGGYGSGQVVAGAGFLLNNEMDDFSAKPGAPNMFGLLGGDANAIAPGKRMLSSMTPTIVVPRRTDVAGGRQPWRGQHHHDGAAGAGECDRSPHERAAGSRCAAISTTNGSPTSVQLEPLGFAADVIGRPRGAGPYDARRQRHGRCPGDRHRARNGSPARRDRPARRRRRSGILKDKEG